MKLRSVRLKIGLIAGICLLATSSVLVLYGLKTTHETQSYVTTNVTQLVNKTTEEGLLATATTRANFIASEIQKNLDTARTLARTFEVLKVNEERRGGNLRGDVNDILLHTLEDNPKFLGAYSAWQPNAAGGRDSDYAGKTGYDKSGRLVPYWNRDPQGKIARQALVEYESQDKHPNGVRKGGWYLGPRETGKESVLDPFPYIVQGQRDWLTTISVPITVNGKFLGVAGTDLRLGFLQELSKEVASKLYDGKAEVAVISNMGLVVAHSQKPDLIGQPMSQFDTKGAETDLQAVQEGKSMIDMGKDSGMVKVVAPIQLGRTDKPWAIMIQVPSKVVMAQAIKLDKSLQDKSSQDTGAQVFVGLIVTCIAIGVLGIATTYIVKPIQRTVTFANDVANGEFDRKLDVNQEDEIGTLANALRKMVENLKEKIDQAEAKSEEAAVQAEKARQAVGEATAARHQADQAKREGMLQAAEKLEAIVEELTSASVELAAQIDESSRGANTQKEQADETAQSMGEMTNRVMQVAQNAGRASESAQSAQDKARAGAEIVRKAVASIGQVQAGALHVKENMGVLGKQAEDIGQIIDVISGIATQTNLLALNAAIEAARAGDLGRGFAVVAEEVRKLAEMTAEATHEVTQAVNSIQAGTRESITNVEESVRAIDEATGLAGSSGDALQAILDLVELAAQQVHLIAAASEDQSAASQQINASIEQIRGISAGNAVAMNESSQAVERLAGQASTLQDLVHELKAA